MNKKVLVTDASQRKAVPIIRSLGKKGVHVVAGEDRPWSMGFFSKYVPKTAVYPSPENETLFIEWLIESAENGLFDILFPIDERTMQPVTKHLEELERFMTVPVVDHETFMIARNKARTMAFAERVGIPIPKTVISNEIDDIKSKLADMPLPAVIKATQSSGSRGLRYVFDHDQLLREYYNVHKKYPFPLIQEYIPKGGNTYGVEVLCSHGSILRVFAHRRIREYPIDGGPSTLRESIYKDDIVQHATILLSEMKWHGVAMVEFKENPQTGECMLLEINPKFWGSIALPIAAGVDFPYLLYQLACNEEVDEDNGYEEHVLCRWLFPGDFLHFIFNPNRFKLEPSFFKFNGMFYDLFDLDDPGPMFLLLFSVVKDVFDIRVWNDKIFR